LRYDYAPMPPELDPIELEVRLFDPDILDLERDWVLDLLDVAPNVLIKQLTQQALFQTELLLMIRVRLTLPVKQGQLLEPVVRRVSIGWPTVTSISTTKLHVFALSKKDAQPDAGRPTAKSRPIRYNPVERRLEWENVGFPRRKRQEDRDVVNCDYHSAMMQLILGHPGELFAAEQLTVHAEVEIPGYLLSGTEARLYGATGNRLEGTAEDPLPELMTWVTATATLQLDDAFAQREFAPYHQFVFDQVEPNEDRITDIVAVLRTAQFDVKPAWQDPDNPPGSDTPKWMLRATRPRDSLSLTIAVEGERHSLEEHLVEESRYMQRRTRNSGWIKLFVRGSLPRDHQELTRQMNELQAALRVRYRQHQR
jgi:hypothetical protein